MNTPEYDRLAKSLLLNNKSGVEDFISEYISKNIGQTSSYEFTLKIADLLVDLAKIIPDITGSFDCRDMGEGEYTLLLYDLIEKHDGELVTLYKVNFKKEQLVDNNR